MTIKIDWEWDVETIDENGDIDHYFQESFADCAKMMKLIEEPARIVLVHSSWNTDTEDLEDRSWAYLMDNGMLPEFTSTPDVNGQYENKYRKVPQKYHREVKRFYGK